MLLVAGLTLLLAAAGLALPAAPPKAPSLTYLYTANISTPAPIVIGSGPRGMRQLIPISGGAFAGPKLSGTIAAASGGDWGLVDANGNFSPDALYIMQTADGANILVTAKGHVPFDYVVFETGSDKYAWLNTVVAVGVGRQMDGAVAMDVFQVSM